ncbi:MAG: N-acyl-D-amino-acid deacylase family protein [Candidatus Puniceispirillales bacterium]|jgi:N-acyl-D-aspartate/D-glutamate deacylase
MDGFKKETESFDLIIRNGTLVDGTGNKSQIADIAVKDGLIAAIGDFSGKSNQEIDASNLVVTPGFVDIHTHYDGQAIWDSQLKPSSIHGVTTVVMGNCGVGFAPCKPEDRIKLVELMEGVEDIPAPVMHEGLDWKWETFEEYIEALERNKLDIDVCALLPHAALRVYVMGERAINHEAANIDDMKIMRKLAKEAVEAGAFGFSTSRTISHKSLKGEFTPTLRAHEDELTAIAMGLSDAGTGFMEIVSDWNEPDPETEFEVLKRIVKKSGRPVVFSCTQRHDRPDFWKDLMEMARQAQKEGLPIRPVVTPRPIGLLLGLNGSQNPFSGTDTYKALAELPLKQRIVEMRKKEIKKQILSEDPIAGSTFPLINRIGYSQMYRFGSPPNYNPRQEDSIENLACINGISAAEMAYDILLENDGNNFIYAPLVNYADHTFSVCQKMLEDKNAIMGLGDGGAHVGFILDAGYPTWLISYWSVKKKVFSMEETVRRLTSDTAIAAGLSDRGFLKVGLKADINIIDWENVGSSDPFMTQDLPAGGKRLMQHTKGYIATIVSGKITYRNGNSTEERPGILVRSVKDSKKVFAYTN